MPSRRWRASFAPGGRFAFTVWGLPGENVGHRIIFEAIEAHAARGLKLPEGPPMFRFADPDETRRLLTMAGLADPVVRTLRLMWDLPAPDGVFDAYRASGVRPAIILGAQTPEALDAIRAAARRAAAPYAPDGRLLIPMTSVLSAARRAA